MKFKIENKKHSQPFFSLVILGKGFSILKKVKIKEESQEKPKETPYTFKYF